MEYGIIEMSIMPDHTHLIADIPLTISVSEALRLLKGCSFHELFKEKQNFRKRYPKGHFWSPGKFYRTVGDTDIETTRCQKSRSSSSDLPIPVFPNWKPRTLVWGGCHSFYDLYYLYIFVHDIKLRF
jgi:putative transposase